MSILVRIHDFVNLIVFSIILILAISFLITYDFFLIKIVGIITTIYLIFDVILLIKFKELLDKRYRSIIIHHIDTIILMIMGYYFQLYKLFAIHLLVELNTIFITIKRYITDKFYKNIMNNLFIYSWIVLRLILYPSIFLWGWFDTYIRSLYPYDYIFALVQGILIILNYYWTYEVLNKNPLPEVENI